MAATHVPKDRAAQHAAEAERLLEGRFIWSYLKAQVHATLAVYYAGAQGTTSYGKPGGRSARFPSAG